MKLNAPLLLYISFSDGVNCFLPFNPGYISRALAVAVIHLGLILNFHPQVLKSNMAKFVCSNNNCNNNMNYSVKYYWRICWYRGWYVMIISVDRGGSPSYREQQQLSWAVWRHRRWCSMCGRAAAQLPFPCEEVPWRPDHHHHQTPRRLNNTHSR